jgi:hypothetical protein
VIEIWSVCKLDGWQGLHGTCLVTSAPTLAGMVVVWDRLNRYEQLVPIKELTQADCSEDQQIALRRSYIDDCNRKDTR